MDFGMSERQGMKVVLEQYGFEPTEERLLLYHEINEGFWSAFERGEVTKDDLVWQRFEAFFGRLRDIVHPVQAAGCFRPGRLHEGAYEFFVGSCFALIFGEGDSVADLCRFFHIKCPLHRRFSVLI